MQIVAILLAAGASTRFHGNKLTADFNGRELYRHALDALCSAPDIQQTIVVVSPDFESLPIIQIATLSSIPVLPMACHLHCVQVSVLHRLKLLPT